MSLFSRAQTTISLPNTIGEKIFVTLCEVGKEYMVDCEDGHPPYRMTLKEILGETYKFFDATGAKVDLEPKDMVWRLAPAMPVPDVHVAASPEAVNEVLNQDFPVTDLTLREIAKEHEAAVSSIESKQAKPPKQKSQPQVLPPPHHQGAIMQIVFVNGEGQRTSMEIDEKTAGILAPWLKKGSRFVVSEERVIGGSSEASVPPLPKAPRAKKVDSTDAQNAVFAVMTNGPVKKADLVELLKLPDGVVGRALAKLREEGKVKSEGNKRAMVWMRV